MSEPQGDAGFRDDAEFAALFNRYLPDAEMPAGLEARLSALVLAEVQTVFGEQTAQDAAVSAAAAAPLQAPATPSLEADSESSLWRPVARSARERTAATADRTGWLEALRTWLAQLRPGQSLAMAGAMSLAVLLVIFGISRLAPRSLTAQATVVNGQIIVLEKRTSIFRTYAAGDAVALRQGDVVLADDGSLQVTFFAGQDATFAQGSQVELALLESDGANIHTELFVDHGAVTSKLERKLVPGDRYLVHAPSLETSVVGTEFLVDVVSDTETRVATFVGNVAVTMDGETVTVAAGEEVEAVAGEPMTVTELQENSRFGNTVIIIAGESGAQLLDSPRADAAVLGILPPGRSFDAAEQDVTGQYARICCLDGQSGWVVIGAGATPVPVPTQTPVPAAQPAPVEGVATATGEAEPVPAETVVAPPENTGPAATPAPAVDVEPAASAANTATPEASATATRPPAATETATSAPTATPTNVSLPTATATETPEPTATATDTPRPTATATETPEPTATATNTPRPTATATDTPVPTATATRTFPTPTPTETPTPTVTATPIPTKTPEPEPTKRPTRTPTPAPTATASNTPVPPTPAPTATQTPLPPTATATHTAQPPPTSTPSVPDLLTPTPTTTPVTANPPTPTATAPVFVPTEETATPIATSTKVAGGEDPDTAHAPAPEEAPVKTHP
jgi:uncharacterized protein YjlB